MDSRSARSASARRRRPPGPPPGGSWADDRHWRGDARNAIRCALAFYALAMLLDGAAGTLSLPRAALWTGLALLVLVVLLPPRVTVGEGWLAVRGLVHERRVRTDALVEVRQYPGVSAHLLLRDAAGRWLELDPRVLVGNALIWHEVDAGVRRSRERGTLRSGTDVLQRLSERIDGAQAHAVFRASGLE
ncbi:hypothetical protein ACFXJ5_03845 [Streptomyces sp. NPDC059373]